MSDGKGDRSGGGEKNKMLKQVQVKEEIVEVEVTKRQQQLVDRAISMFQRITTDPTIISAPAAAAAAGFSACGPTLPPAQLTIFYSGTVSVFDAVPADVAQNIMFIAAVAAKTSAAKNTNNTMNGGLPCTSASPVLTRSLSLQSTAAVEASSPPQLHSVPPSILKLHAELPIARRHSLQRFLEKRRDRLVSKSPYPPGTPTKLAEGSLSGETDSFCGTETAIIS